MDSPFLFPRRVDSAIEDLEEAKNLAGKSPPPDSDRLNDAEFGKISPASLYDLGLSGQVLHACG